MLEERHRGRDYHFKYHDTYTGPPVSLSMPLNEREFFFTKFPPFFDGLLPEGLQLEGLLKIRKIDADDYFSQLVAVGSDLVGAVTVKEDADDE
ncbi:MAG TPA: HipA N-terminal domain-containing protein [Oligoflexus sp.]|uniref:HipA N-terminal domain-containing protein n=1 Tax=Oligoflexus sp. TaxID=1971216 RepID=UPI002D3CE849|nr:HipA N-terminal domain-containing protein [Oligoflexus sp.]HYX34920.1 HipA N-terminal domain-containing protein [Oligoflexus sp.]